MKRRDFIKATGIGAAGAAIAAPAIAQSMPELKWRMTTSWPKSLDTLYGGAEIMAKAVAEATDNKFQIQVFAAGEIVPGLQVLDAVQNGTVEMGHTASYYYFGKDPTFALRHLGRVRAQRAHQPGLVHARRRQGAAQRVLQELQRCLAACRQHHLSDGRLVPQGDQHGRRSQRPEIPHRRFRRDASCRSSACVPQQIAGGDIYPALEKGTIDAAEWVGPYDDEKLGLYKVAPHYYYPGWWEGGPMLLALVNLDKWNALPKQYQSFSSRPATTPTPG